MQSAREDIAEQIKDLAESLSKGLATEKVISSLESVRKEVALFSLDKNNDYNKSSIQNAQDVQARQVLTDKRGNKYFGREVFPHLSKSLRKVAKTVPPLFVKKEILILIKKLERKLEKYKKQRIT